VPLTARIGILVLALGVAQAATPTISAPASRTVTDDSGRTVSVGAAPLRIVSLAPGATEMLFAAGAGAQVIATVE
jgi:ABC-type Fe3+-hydroxamate transport system substrate-binding protein